MNSLKVRPLSKGETVTVLKDGSGMRCDELYAPSQGDNFIGTQNSTEERQDREDEHERTKKNERVKRRKVEHKKQGEYRDHDGFLTREELEEEDDYIL